MNFTQWKNFGYPGQELAPLEPVLAWDNLVTLTNYGRLCSILFVITRRAIVCSSSFSHWHSTAAVGGGCGVFPAVGRSALPERS